MHGRIFSKSPQGPSRVFVRTDLVHSTMSGRQREPLPKEWFNKSLRSPRGVCLGDRLDQKAEDTRKGAL